MEPHSKPPLSHVSGTQAGGGVVFTGAATHEDGSVSVNVNIQTQSLVTSFPTRTEHALADNFLGAEEAREYGLIDEILVSRKGEEE